MSELNKILLDHKLWLDTNAVSLYALLFLVFLFR